MLASFKQMRFPISRICALLWLWNLFGIAGLSRSVLAQQEDLTDLIIEDLMGIDRDSRAEFAVMPPSSLTGPFPFIYSLEGNPDFESEELTAFERGYRYVPAGIFSQDIAAFYNDYDKSREFREHPPEFQGACVYWPYIIANDLSGDTYGVEPDVGWQTSKTLKFDLAYSSIDGDISNDDQQGSPPRHQVSLQTSLTPLEYVDVDVWLRYVGESEAKYVYDPDRFYDGDEYLTMDLRLAWHPSKQADFSMFAKLATILEGP